MSVDAGGEKAGQILSSCPRASYVCIAGAREPYGTSETSALRFVVSCSAHVRAKDIGVDEASAWRLEPFFYHHRVKGGVRNLPVSRVGEISKL